MGEYQKVQKAAWGALDGQIQFQRSIKNILAVGDWNTQNWGVFTDAQKERDRKKKNENSLATTNSDYYTKSLF